MCNRIFIVSLFLLVLANSAFTADVVSLSDSQFVMLYVDLSFAAEQFLSDSIKLTTTQDSIFESHMVSRDQFFEYKAELDNSPERWSGIWKMIAQELTLRESLLQTEEKTTEKTKPKRNKKK